MRRPKLKWKNMNGAKILRDLREFARRERQKWWFRFAGVAIGHILYSPFARIQVQARDEMDRIVYLEKAQTAASLIFFHSQSLIHNRTERGTDNAIEFRKLFIALRC